LNLTEGSAGCFNLGNKTNLLIVIHHLAVDGVSWQLLEDFQTAYEQVSRGVGIYHQRQLRSSSGRSLQECSQQLQQSGTTGWQSDENRSLACELFWGENTVAGEHRISLTEERNPSSTTASSEGL